MNSQARYFHPRWCYVLHHLVQCAACLGRAVGLVQQSTNCAETQDFVGLSLLPFSALTCSSFYRPAAVAIAQVVIDMPLAAIQVTVFNIIVYLYVTLILIKSKLIPISMANLSRTASQFFINYLFTWLITITMYSFFRAIGALSGSLDIGM